MTSKMNSLISKRIPGNAPKVLVIEDDADVAEITRYLVNQYSGGRCDWVEDSYAAINALYEKRYDYVIVDQNLPGLKGLQVLASIDRAIDRDPILSSETRFMKSMPVLFMSGGPVKIPADYKLNHFIIQDVIAKKSLGLGLARNLAS